MQYITHTNARLGYADGALLALQGGCRWIQLRMKGASDEEVKAEASRIMPLCRELGATFVIDDRVNLAREIGADGVHLGKDDMPVAEARELLGSRAIIGATANTFADIARLAAQGADYIGCGPFRFTTTKQRLAPTLGLQGYQDIIRRMCEAGITLPVVAIGGITVADVAALMAVGLTGVAVSGAVLNAADPAAEMARFVAETERGALQHTNN